MTIGSRNFAGNTDRLSLICVGAFLVVALWAYSLPLLALFRGMMQEDLWPVVTDRDFANYWMAGKLVFTGEQHDLFIQDAYFHRLQAVFGPDYPEHNWSYPPHFLLVVWPLGFFGYKTGMMLFLGVSAVCFVLAAIAFRQAYAPRSRMGVLFLALFCYFVVMLDASQNGFLTGAFVLLGLAWKDRWPIVAGMAFGLLTMKPQLGVLVPLLLAFEQNWKAIASTVLAAAVLVLLSSVVFGVDCWILYVTETVEFQRKVMTDGAGTFLRMMPTVFASLRVIGVSSLVAYVLQWVVTVCTVVAVGWLIWQDSSSLRKSFYLLCGTFLASPYAFNYDMGALSVVAAVLAGSDQLKGRPAVILVSIVAAITVSVFNLGRSHLTVVPLLLAAAFLSVAKDFASSKASSRDRMSDLEVQPHA